MSSIATPSSYLSPASLVAGGGVGGGGVGGVATPQRPTVSAPAASAPLTAEEMATDYCCYGRFPLLHCLVISLLIGITLLIVGLVINTAE